MTQGNAPLQEFSAVMAAVFAALGFAAPWPHVVTGALFAVAGGYAGMFVSPPKERLGVWSTLLVALVIGFAAGLAQPVFAHAPLGLSFIADAPLQVVMLFGGLCSRWVAKRLVSGSLPMFKTRREDDGAA